MLPWLHDKSKSKPHTVHEEGRLFFLKLKEKVLQKIILLFVFFRLIKKQCCKDGGVSFGKKLAGRFFPNGWLKG